eukprot:COSAG06_NODE_360_length_16832_cov_9.250209_19_plen_247_part_00
MWLMRSDGIVTMALLCTALLGGSSSSVDPPGCGGCTRHVFPEAVETHGARCLDGSPPGLFFRRGRGADARKFIVYSHGGAWCWDMNTTEDHGKKSNCVIRATTYEGSSNATVNPPSGPPRGNMDKGLMSTNCTTNPRFCDWSVVYFMYCDGSSFTGSRTAPHVYEGVSIWSRGRQNMDALFHHLLADRATFGLADATQVIVTGASAGGYFTFYHCDYIRERYITDMSVPMHCVPDAGKPRPPIALI